MWVLREGITGYVLRALDGARGGEGMGGMGSPGVDAGAGWEVRGRVERCVGGTGDEDGGGGAGAEVSAEEVAHFRRICLGGLIVRDWVGRSGESGL